MRYYYLFLGVLIANTACAMSPEERRTGPAATRGGSQQDMAGQAHEQRERASKLHDMAERRAVEAEVQANELGPQDTSVRQKRKLATDLDAAGDEAEQQGRDLRQQVPHGMVQ